MIVKALPNASAMPASVSANKPQTESDAPTDFNTTLIKASADAKPAMVKKPANPAGKADGKDADKPTGALLLMPMPALPNQALPSEPETLTENEPGDRTVADLLQNTPSAAGAATPPLTAAVIVDAGNMPVQPAAGAASQTETTQLSERTPSAIKAAVNPLTRPAHDIKSGSPESESAASTQQEALFIPKGDGDNLSSMLPNVKTDPSSREPIASTEPQAATPAAALSSAVAAQARTASTAMNTVSGSLPQSTGTPAWQQALSQQILCFTRDGVHNAELRLHPEELGSLQISLRLNNDRAQLHFMTGNHQVQAALEAAMPQLRSSLAESGIQLGQSSIGAETSSWQGDASHGESPGQQHQAQQHASRENNAESSNKVITQTHIHTTGISMFI
ncbi:flagellar hook-length control protein FliK [Pantoea sp.]|uniref:flagellar hook-length control protein FliK n=1 Tax=Pantoea sp. TaxID=69393 RepID=UPI002896D154|nr:flagellar hook-length control protein FliK [Pantoea sp.]